MQRMKIAAIALGLATQTLWATPVSAQKEAELVFQTERTGVYEAYLDAEDADYSAQLDNGVDIDKARMSLILIKLARIRLEADRMSTQIGDASHDIDAALMDLAELIGDEIIGNDPDFDTELEDIETRIDDANGEIEAALDDFGETLDTEGEQISDLAGDLLDSGDPFEVTFRIEGNGVRDDEVVTVTRADLDDLEAAIEDGEFSGQALADAIAGLREATSAWGDALDWLDLATSATDNQAAIDAMRSGIGHLDGALIALEDVFASGPLDIGLDTGEARALLTDMDDILGGRTFAIGERTVRPVALIESRTQAAYLGLDLLDPAILLSLMADREFSQADRYEGLDDIRMEKAQTRGWTWVLMAASAVGLSDPADALLGEFWSSSTPAEETLRGYFPKGFSAAMLQVLGVDLVVNTNATRDEMDAHMTIMRALFAARVEQDPSDGEAHAGLALVRTYFLVANNQRDVFDVIELTMAGDIIGIVDRFDTEDFDYSASLDSIEQDLDSAREETDLVFLVIDKLDDDGNLFTIEMDDDVIPLPLASGVLDAGLNIIGALATTATALAEAGSNALGRMEESLELDLDPNELDFTDSETPLDVALALEVSNPDFLRLSPEGANDMVDMGNRIEDALDAFADAVTEFHDLAVDLEDGDGPQVQGIAGFADDVDEFYGDMQQDFSNGPATTEIDGEEIDLSARFDHPPTQLLQQFIWFLDDDDDTDNTLAGLLPGRSAQSVVHEDHSANVPDDFALGQNYPNPFNSGTVIDFALPVTSRVSLRLYDLLGQEVLRLSEGERAAGSYRVLWDGTGADDKPLASGVYYYQLLAGDQIQTRSLLLLR